MTQEEKSLLLKDLCARVPYHPKGPVVNARLQTLSIIVVCISVQCQV